MFSKVYLLHGAVLIKTKSVNQSLELKYIILLANKINKILRLLAVLHPSNIQQNLVLSLKTSCNLIVLDI